MTKVVLHGDLAHAVGRAVWHLHVSNVQEALRAIEANTGKFYAHLTSKEGGQAPYHVTVDKRGCTGVDHFVVPKAPKEIHIMPAIAGAGDGGLLAIIGIVLVLIAVTIFTWGADLPFLAAMSATGTVVLGTTGTLIATTLLMTGLSLVMSGISQMLMPSQPAAPVSSPSYVFNGVENTTKQGVCVPVGYGQLMIGSAVISAGLSSVPFPLNSSNPTQGYTSSSGK